MRVSLAAVPHACFLLKYNWDIISQAPPPLLFWTGGAAYFYHFGTPIQLILTVFNCSADPVQNSTYLGVGRGSLGIEQTTELPVISPLLTAQLTAGTAQVDMLALSLKFFSAAEDDA